jgi:hypothetical protein
MERKYLAMILADSYGSTAAMHSLEPCATVGSKQTAAMSPTCRGQKDGLLVDHTSVDTSLEVVENLVDMLFPQSTGFLSVPARP